MSNPFRYFNSSPKVIRLVVMMYVRYPLSLRNVEDLLAERGNREARQSRGAEASQAGHEEIRASEDHRHRRTSRLFRGDERGRRRRSAGGRPSAQQSCREFASAVSATRTGDAALSKSEDAAEVQLSSRPGPQPIQSGAPSRHEASLQAEALCCLGRVARPRGIDRRSRDGGRLRVDEPPLL